MQQEDNIKKRLSLASLNDQLLIEANGTQFVAGKPPIAEKAPISPRLIQDQVPSSSSSASSPQGSEKRIGGKADRKNDPIYQCTTNVVRAVMTLSNGVEKSQINDYLELVKTVGLELRTLLGTVDQVSANFPPQTHKYVPRHNTKAKTLKLFLCREVEMAHKVLSKDMKDLVASMHRAMQYCDTTLDVECRK